MTTLDLLEATKVEVDLRWTPDAYLWDRTGGTGSACILGCLGFARWGQEFSDGRQEGGYARLRTDPATHDAIVALAENSDVDDGYPAGWARPNCPLEMVWRQNDFRLQTKQDAKAFIDLAIADLKSS